MEITRAGFGAWAVGGGEWSFGWGAQDDAESIASIRHAVESGVDWVDTAAVYGLGHSEEVVAAALEPYSESDRPHVFTKGGLRWDPSDPMAPARRVVISAGLEDSPRGVTGGPSCAAKLGVASSRRESWRRSRRRRRGLFSFGVRSWTGPGASSGARVIPDLPAAATLSIMERRPHSLPPPGSYS